MARMIRYLFPRWTLLLAVLFLSVVSNHKQVGVVWAAEDAADEVTNVEFEVQLSPGVTDKFTIEVHSAWAPIGAARFLELVDNGEGFW